MNKRDKMKKSKWINGNQDKNSKLKKYITENPLLTWFSIAMLLIFIYVSLYITFPENSLLIAISETGWIPPLMWVFMYIIIFSFGICMWFCLPGNENREVEG